MALGFWFTARHDGVMSATLCLIGKHKWTGCRCDICYEPRDLEHQWLPTCDVCDKPFFPNPGPGWVVIDKHLACGTKSEEARHEACRICEVKRRTATATPFRGFPIRGEEVWKRGRTILSFATAGERLEMMERRSADVLLAKLGMNQVGDILLTGHFASSFEGQFLDELSRTGQQATILPVDERRELIKALEWFIANMQDFHVRVDVGGTPILAHLSSKLIVPQDKFKARTRMYLAAFENMSRPVALEDYIGYLADDWLQLE